MQHYTDLRERNLILTFGGLGGVIIVLCVIIWFLLVKSSYIVKDVFQIFSLTEKEDID